MPRKRAFFLVFVWIVTLAAPAMAKDPYLVRLPLKGLPMLERLHDAGIEILTLARDGHIDVVADDKQLAVLQSLGHPISIIGTPEMASANAMLDDSLGQYHTYGELEDELDSLVVNYPLITKLEVIGTSIEGRDISVLKISDNPLIDEPEAEVLIMGCHHARELMSVEIPFKFAEYLLANYGIDPTVTNLIDNREIYIAPMINPDGHVYVENNHAGAWWTWWRKNRRDNGDGSFGVDLNRNYGYNWGVDNVGSSPFGSNDLYRGSGPFSEPETQAVRDFCESRDFSVAFSYHSYGELLLLPWGYDFTYTPDHEVYVTLGDSLASQNGYFVGNPAMGAIYLTNGGSDDWGYGEQVTKNKIFSYTPEVNTSAQGGFGPPETLIQPTFDLLLPMNMSLVQYADNPYSVVGPYRPTMNPVDNSWNPNYVLSWSDNDPNDPNPVVSYDVIEYKNYHTTIDSANALSGLWEYNGFTVSGMRAQEGSGSYFSGAANNDSRHITTSTFYSVSAETDTFTSWFWYDIEMNWDYAYVEVSTDGGLIWTSLAGNLTTTSNPNGNNTGHGITGSSGGWTQGFFALTAYLGQDVRLRLNYVTDASVLGEGIYADLLTPVPTYDMATIVGDDLTGTTSLFMSPSMTGTYTYLVRAQDAEGHMSKWSNSEKTIVSTVTAAGTVVPQTRLGANYPNPFNPMTRIPYAIGSSETATGPVQVTLIIYDVNGRRVTTLADETKTAGVYEATWRGIDDQGNVMSTGVYFARLTVSGESAFVRKLVLLK